MIEVEGTAYGPDAAENAVTAAAAKMHATCDQRRPRGRVIQHKQEEGEDNASCHDELTLDEMLNDPLIDAVMRADGVDPEQLGIDLARLPRSTRPSG